MYTKLHNPVGQLLSIMLFSFIAVESMTAQVKISEQEWIIPTYLVSPPDKNPMFFKGESYQGASKYIYPYGLNDMISDEKTNKAWKALTLENEYIKLCVTPEIGGKLYYATDKTNNYNFVYKNNVVKPSNIGMLGAWVSGGIEWCVLHHHRASTFLPVDYTLAENEDGSRTIWIGETEPRHRMRWTIGITVFPGRSYFEAEVKIHNPTPYTNTFLYWANVAAHTNENYQAIFPPSVRFATFHAKNSFTHWPFSTEVYAGQDFTKGVDVSWWKNVTSSSSFFAYDLKEDFMGGYDHGKETGTVHIGDHNIIKGTKLWEWGSGARGQATEARLTDNDGPYVEIMVGAFSDNQPDYSWIKPYEVKTFKQYWYPVKDIQGFRNANLNGAVNMEVREKNQVFLGYYSTRKVSKANIVLKKSGKIIFEKNMEISPENAFNQLIKIDGSFDITDLSTEMTDSETGEILVSYYPVKKQNEEKLPEIVRRPELPKDMATVEELYLTGSRIQQFYNPTMNAMDYYEEALKRDPYDIRTSVAVGNTFLKNGDYIRARGYFVKAIKRLTKDYTRPSTCEALYLQGLTLKALELYDEAVDTLYRATWDYAFHSAAYLELARISCLKGDLTKALDQVNESLSTNSRNNSAISLKASIQRRMGDYKGSMTTLANVPVNDPLDFRAGNENYLIIKESGDIQKAEKELAGLTRKMRDFDQNYLELGVSYLNDGLINEAEDILSRFKGKNPLVYYYLGYIKDNKRNKEQAEKLFEEGSELPVDYCFPFMLETIKVLKLASEYNSADAKPWYYLGNLLYDKQPQKAIECWEKAVKLDPSFAIAFRNLGWGYYQAEGDGYKAISAYEKAINIKRDEPVYYSELDALYEMSNAPIEKRLNLFEGSNDVVKKRDDSFVRQIIVLTLAGKPEKAVEYLSGRNFSYREGNSRVREVIIDAHLMLGKKYFAEKNYQKALEHFLLAQVPDEEGGSARAGSREIQVNYHIGLTYEALGNKTQAKNYFKLAADQNLRGSNYIGYYQGLSFLKSGNKTRASEIFNSLIADGDKQISQGSNTDVDFFAKFGEREAKNVQLSNAYMLKGLGYKGLGDTEMATENLKKAVELSASNLYAKVELMELTP
jgi:tetratricopeptide (TPR) repeat protein